MTPPPTLDELLSLVRADAASEDQLDLLATAAVTVRELTETADAVLGHYVDQARASGRTWTEISNVLGVSKQAVHKRFVNDPDFSRYTERARRSVRASEDASRRLGHNYVGTEHLVLGLLDSSVVDSVANGILRDHDVTENSFERAVLQRIGRGAGASSDHVPFTPRARKLLATVVPEAALELGHSYIGTEHILLAVTRSDGIARDLLKELGLDAERAQAAVIEALTALRRK